MGRLLITVLGALTAVLLMAGPASALAQETGQGPKTSIDPVTEDRGDNPAHGPSRGEFLPLGFEDSGTNPGGPAGQGTDPGGLEPVGNLGAWNAFFNTRDTSSSICGIWAYESEVPDGGPAMFCKAGSPE